MTDLLTELLNAYCISSLPICLNILSSKLYYAMLKLTTRFPLLQDHLGDVVFVELPEVGNSVSQGNNFGAVESVKATSDVNSPVSGEVVEVNKKLSEEPGLVSCGSTVSKANLKTSLPWVD
jgi:hypothetical protein